MKIIVLFIATYFSLNFVQAQTPPVNDLMGRLGNKVWGIKDADDSRSQPCSDRDGGGVKRRQALIVEFSQQSNGNIKISYSRFGNGEKTPIKYMDLNQVSKRSDSEYLLKGTWFSQTDSRLTGAYEVLINLQNNPTLKDKWQEPGFSGMLSAMEATELFACNSQQVTLLGKTNQQINSENKQKQAKFDASPEGKVAYLRDKYVSMMTVQDCYDVRRKYELQYTDSSVLNKAKSAMRTIENNVKKELPNIDTKKIWADAGKEYAASFGMHLEANKLHPENYSNTVKGYCGVAALDLINSTPKQLPTKSF